MLPPAWSPNCANARERKCLETGKKVGGRQAHAELWPEVVTEARRLRRTKGKAGRLSYREISIGLKEAGYCNERGQPFNPQSVHAMVEGPQPRQRRPIEGVTMQSMPATRSRSWLSTASSCGGSSTSAKCSHLSNQAYCVR